MTSSGDDDRPRLSWREIDQRRDSKRSGEEQRPRGRSAQAEEKRASDEYKKHLDTMFSEEQGGAEGEQLAQATREAHGTPEFVSACQAYRDAVGWPADAELLGLFIDSGEQDLVVGALEAVLAGIEREQTLPSKGLRSQIALLAEDFNSAIADVAEEILERL